MSDELLMSTMSFIMSSPFEGGALSFIAQQAKKLGVTKMLQP